MVQISVAFVLFLTASYQLFEIDNVYLNPASLSNLVQLLPCWLFILFYPPNIRFCDIFHWIAKLEKNSNRHYFYDKQRIVVLRLNLTRLGLQCQTPLRPYPWTLIPYPYPLSPSTVPSYYWVGE